MNYAEIAENQRLLPLWLRYWAHVNWRLVWGGCRDDVATRAYPSLGPARQLFPDSSREQEGEDSRSGTDVRCDLAWLYLEGIDRKRGLLFPLAFRTIQPAGALVPHNVRDLSAHIELADALRIIIFSLLISRPRLGFLGRLLALRIESLEPDQEDDGQEDGESCEQGRLLLGRSLVSPPSELEGASLGAGGYIQIGVSIQVGQ